MIQQQFFKGADGVRLAADVGGKDSAPTVMLTHGAGQTRYSWKSTAQTLMLELGFGAYPASVQLEMRRMDDGQRIYSFNLSRYFLAR